MFGNLNKDLSLKNRISFALDKYIRDYHPNLIGNLSKHASDIYWMRKGTISMLTQKAEEEGMVDEKMRSFVTEALESVAKKIKLCKNKRELELLKDKEEIYKTALASI
ncbi:MAG: hypothetical protein GF364_00105 [Candidatus Lokiarchaeota archaeon]|nr:hypothetical protein [Candidatus Lokiarchaeota archaeon]